jgi:hypothetical protein
VNKTELILGLFGFIITVICVAVLEWQARDIIWGLWISSLSIGYAYIVAVVIASVYNSKSRKERIGNIISGPFFLAFFTVHFGMFHFVHAIFLNCFFPLVELNKGFPNGFLFLSASFLSYWPFVAATLISSYQDFSFKKIKKQGKGQEAFMKPYANVVRMHILIFVFAGLHAARMAEFAIYPVLVFYFFPWKSFFEYLKKKRKESKKEK